jgi:hypothetical protein
LKVERTLRVVAGVDAVHDEEDGGRSGHGDDQLLAAVRVVLARDLGPCAAAVGTSREDRVPAEIRTGVGVADERIVRVVADADGQGARDGRSDREDVVLATVSAATRRREVVRVVDRRQIVRRSGERALARRDVVALSGAFLRVRIGRLGFARAVAERRRRFALLVRGDEAVSAHRGVVVDREVEAPASLDDDVVGGLRSLEGQIGVALLTDRTSAGRADAESAVVGREVEDTTRRREVETVDTIVRGGTAGRFVVRARREVPGQNGRARAHRDRVRLTRTRLVVERRGLGCFHRVAFEAHVDATSIRSRFVRERARGVARIDRRTRRRVGHPAAGGPVTRRRLEMVVVPSRIHELRIRRDVAGTGEAGDRVGRRPARPGLAADVTPRVAPEDGVLQRDRRLALQEDRRPGARVVRDRDVGRRERGARATRPGTIHVDRVTVVRALVLVEEVSLHRRDGLLIEKETGPDERGVVVGPHVPLQSDTAAAEDSTAAPAVASEDAGHVGFDEVVLEGATAHGEPEAAAVIVLPEVALDAVAENVQVALAADPSAPSTLVVVDVGILDLDAPRRGPVRVRGEVDTATDLRVRRDRVGLGVVYLEVRQGQNAGTRPLSVDPAAMAVAVLPIGPEALASADRQTVHSHVVRSGSDMETKTGIGQVVVEQGSVRPLVPNAEARTALKAAQDVEPLRAEVAVASDDRILGVRPLSDLDRVAGLRRGDRLRDGSVRACRGSGARVVAEGRVDTHDRRIGRMRPRAGRDLTVVSTDRPHQVVRRLCDGLFIPRWIPILRRIFRRRARDEPESHHNQPEHFHDSSPLEKPARPPSFVPTPVGSKRFTILIDRNFTLPRSDPHTRTTTPPRIYRK